MAERQQNDATIPSHPSVVIITGGARGIGGVLVRGFLSHGYSVASCDILPFKEAVQPALGTKEAKTTTSKCCSSSDDQSNPFLFTCSPCDVSQESQVKNFLEKTSEYFKTRQFHCLINNAAMVGKTTIKPEEPPKKGEEEKEAKKPLLAEIDLDSFRKTLEVNVFGTMFMMKHCAPYLIHVPSSKEVVEEKKEIEKERRKGEELEELEQQNWGSIINISSTRSQMSEPQWEGYAASKGAIDSLTHAVAISNPKLRVNAIRPGWINVDPSYSPSDEDCSFHPCGRVGQGTDILEMCLFLSDGNKAGFITGQCFNVDGGVSKKMIYPE